MFCLLSTMIEICGFVLKVYFNFFIVFLTNKCLIIIRYKTCLIKIYKKLLIKKHNKISETIMKKQGWEIGMFYFKLYLRVNYYQI